MLSRVETAEAKLISIAMDSKRPLDMNVPEGATLAEVDHALGVAIGGYGRLTEAAERLKPIVGRFILVVRERALWEGKYKNFTDWLNKRVVGELSFSRSNALAALKIARAFPTLTEAQYAHYGASKLLKATEITDETKPDWKPTLEKFAKMTFPEVVAEVRELRGNTGDSGAEPSITIRVSEDDKLWYQAQVKTGIEPPALFAALRKAYTESKAGRKALAQAAKLSSARTAASARVH